MLLIISINSWAQTEAVKQTNSVFLKKKKKSQAFIYLAAPALSCGMCDLVSWLGIIPRTPAKEHSLSHWTTREVPNSVFLLSTSNL